VDVRGGAESDLRLDPAHRGRREASPSRCRRTSYPAACSVGRPTYAIRKLFVLAPRTRERKKVRGTRDRGAISPAGLRPATSPHFVARGEESPLTGHRAIKFTGRGTRCTGEGARAARGAEWVSEFAPRRPLPGPATSPVLRLSRSRVFVGAGCSFAGRSTLPTPRPPP
jgi:hypothetical protein